MGECDGWRWAIVDEKWVAMDNRPLVEDAVADNVGSRPIPIFQHVTIPISVIQAVVAGRT